MFNLFEKDYISLASDPNLIPFLNTLPSYLSKWQNENEHGDFKIWCKQLEKIKDLTSNNNDFSNYIKIGDANEIPIGRQKQLFSVLKMFEPWRKGPYNLFGIELESEWRSDMKWDRLKNLITPLKNRYVLDVGCGNGYHLWRMFSSGAKQVIGIDPMTLYYFQFAIIKSLAGNPNNIHFFPMGLDEFQSVNVFDTVFDMGVLYHLRAPINHLEKLYTLLRNDGELVLETLIINGDETNVLTPIDRYAKMGNIWFIPSIPTLKIWLEKVGFKNIRVVSVVKTTDEEQHSTNWSCSQSLIDFLDPNDNNKTIEGYDAPIRAIVLAQK